MKNKNLLMKRIGAYLIDTIIISIIIEMLIQIPFLKPNEKKYNSINENLEKIIVNFENDEISLNDFKNEYIVINYNLLKLENKINICRICLVFLYFVILQWKFNGQTIGKKLFKIKVVSNTDNELSFTNCFFRALLINNLFLYIMLLFGRYYLNDVSNYYLALSINVIRNTILYCSAILILFRKDARGLHDLIVKTKVIEA